MVKTKVGVFLFRGQPVHKGHLFMIKKALEENDKVLLVLGSANKEGMLRNPFDLETRQNWLINGLGEDKEITLDDVDKLGFLSLPDWTTETDKDELVEWGHYLYYNIVRMIGQKEFNIYYNDDKSIIESWFDEEIKDKITIKHFERSSVFNELSATKIRQAIIDSNMEYLERFLPQCVIKEIDEIKQYLIEVNENPKQDFSM